MVAGIALQLFAAAWSRRPGDALPADEYNVLIIRDQPLGKLRLRIGNSQQTRWGVKKIGQQQLNRHGGLKALLKTSPMAFRVATCSGVKDV